MPVPTSVGGFRSLYSDGLAGYSDQQIADAAYRTYYSSMNRDAFDSAFLPPQAQPPETELEEGPGLFGGMVGFARDLPGNIYTGAKAGLYGFRAGMMQTFDGGRAYTPEFRDAAQSVIDQGGDLDWWFRTGKFKPAAAERQPIDRFAMLGRLVEKEGGHRGWVVEGDTAGQTWAGISRKWNPNWRGWAKIDAGEEPTIEDVYDLYTENYWNPIRADEMTDYAIAESVLSEAVHGGVGTAAGLVQKVLGIEETGRFDDATIEALNNADQAGFQEAFKNARIERYHNIVRNDETQRKFLQGWINRAESDAQITWTPPDPAASAAHVAAADWFSQMDSERDEREAKIKSAFEKRDALIPPSVRANRWAPSSLAFSLSETVARMAPGVLAGLVLRHPAPLAASYASMGTIAADVYGETLYEGLERGLDREQAQIRAATFALAEGATEKLPVDVILGMGKGAWREGWKKILAGRGLASLGSAALAEGGQEVLVEGINKVADYTFDKAFEGGLPGYENQTFGEIVNDLLYAGTLGAGAGATLRGGAMGVEKGLEFLNRAEAQAREEAAEEVQKLLGYDSPLRLPSPEDVNVVRRPDGSPIPMPGPPGEAPFHPDRPVPPGEAIPMPEPGGQIPWHPQSLPAPEYTEPDPKAAKMRIISEGANEWQVRRLEEVLEKWPDLWKGWEAKWAEDHQTDPGARVPLTVVGMESEHQERTEELAAITEAVEAGALQEEAVQSRIEWLNRRVGAIKDAGRRLVERPDGAANNWVPDFAPEENLPEGESALLDEHFETERERDAWKRRDEDAGGQDPVVTANIEWLDRRVKALQKAEAEEFKRRPLAKVEEETEKVRGELLAMGPDAPAPDVERLRTRLGELQEQSRQEQAKLEGTPAAVPEAPVTMRGLREELSQARRDFLATPEGPERQRLQARQEQLEGAISEMERSDPAPVEVQPNPDHQPGRNLPGTVEELEAERKSHTAEVVQINPHKTHWAVEPRWEWLGGRLKAINEKIKGLKEAEAEAEATAAAEAFAAAEAEAQTQLAELRSEQESVSEQLLSAELGEVDMDDAERERLRARSRELSSRIDALEAGEQIPDAETAEAGGEGTYQPYQSGGPKPSLVAGDTATLTTSKKDKRGFSWAVIEADELVPSHNVDGVVNADYPTALQPRNRSNRAMLEQMQQIRSDVDPDLLRGGDSAHQGAVIVRPDGVVLSGNGRTAGIQAAYNDNKTISKYRNWVRKRASKYGIDGDKVRGMDRPVLVRVIDRMDEAQTRAFVVDANTSGVAGSSGTEDAKTDAQRITPEMMAKYAPREDGDPLAASNRPFMDDFLATLGSEASNYRDAQGNPNQAARNRVSAAIFQLAYQSDRLTAMLVDDAFPVLTNPIKALQIAAPAFVRARAASENLGGLDLPKTLADGLGIVLDAHSKGQKVSEFTAQTDAFSDTATTDRNAVAIALFIDKNKRSAKKMGESFKRMAQSLERRLENPDQGSLVPEEPVSVRWLIEEVARIEGAPAAQGGLGLTGGQGRPGGDNTTVAPVPPPSDGLFGSRGQRTEAGTTSEVEPKADYGKRKDFAVAWSKEEEDSPRRVTGHVVDNTVKVGDVVKMAGRSKNLELRRVTRLLGIVVPPNYKSLDKAGLINNQRDAGKLVVEVKPVEAANQERRGEDERETRNVGAGESGGDQQRGATVPDADGAEATEPGRTALAPGTEGAGPDRGGQDTGGTVGVGQGDLAGQPDDTGAAASPPGGRRRGGGGGLVAGQRTDDLGAGIRPETENDQGLAEQDDGRHAVGTGAGAGHGAGTGVRGLTEAEQTEQAELEALEQELKNLSSGKIRSGLDPDEISLIVRISALQIKRGWRKFKDYHRGMIEYLNGVAQGLGDRARKYLKRLYEGAKRSLDAAIVAEMNSSEEVDAFLEEEAKLESEEVGVAGNTESRVPYEGMSGDMREIKTPVFLAGPQRVALEKLRDEVGDLTEYVKEELGYESAEEVGGRLYPYQIDAVALSIARARAGLKMINSDETGMGKGRVAASMLRWAKRNGKIPVFMTNTDQLFNDMARDLTGIKEPFNPLIVNNGITLRLGSGGEKVQRSATGEARSSMLRRIAEDGRLPTGRDMMFLTYSQLNYNPGNPENETRVQRAALRALAENDNVFFVLDEVHKAAGKVVSKDNRNEEYLSAAGFLVNTIRDKPALMLSATFAKRPDNMLAFFNGTPLESATENFGELHELLVEGGEIMQAWVSAALAEEGALVRRERGYDGITFEDHVTESQRERQRILFDTTTSGINDITVADVSFASAVRRIAVDRYGRDAVRSFKRIQQASPFSARIHTIVSQVLMASKLDATVELAIEAHKAGEKPIIVVHNTMEAILKHYRDNGMATMGDPFPDTDFRAVLLKGLESTRKIRLTPREGMGLPFTIDIPMHELPPDVAQFYNDAERNIRALDLGGLPISPLDHVTEKLTSAGIKVGELTGRKYVLDMKNGNRLRARKDKNKDSVISDFNGGELDALVMNTSASTGISLHSSGDFKDQKARAMFILQAAPDINDYVQILGRTNRVGQVVPPRYVNVTAALPAEQKLGAMLRKKLASLAANTTANTESDLQTSDVDLLGKHGIQVLKDFLRENRALADRLGINNTDGTGFAIPFMNRMAVLPVAEQDAVFKELDARFDAYIELIRETGRDDTVKTRENIKAQIAQSTVLKGGSGEGGRFGADVVMHIISADLPKNTVTPKQARAAVKEGLGGKSAKEVSMQLIDKRERDTAYRDRLEERREVARRSFRAAQDAGGHAQIKAARERLRQVEKAIDTYEKNKELLTNLLLARTNVGGYMVGSRLFIDTGRGRYAAVVTELIDSHQSSADRSPWSLGSVKARLAVNGHPGQITLSFHALWTKMSADSVEAYPHADVGMGADAWLDKYFRPRPEGAASARVVAVGNLLEALRLLGHQAGSLGAHGYKLTEFTDSEGNRHDGMLSAPVASGDVNFWNDLIQSVGLDAPVEEVDAILNYLRSGDVLEDSPRRLYTDGGSIVIKHEAGDWFVLRVFNRNEDGRDIVGWRWPQHNRELRAIMHGGAMELKLSDLRGEATPDTNRMRYSGRFKADRLADVMRVVDRVARMSFKISHADAGKYEEAGGTRLEAEASFDGGRTTAKRRTTPIRDPVGDDVSEAMATGVTGYAEGLPAPVRRLIGEDAPTRPEAGAEEDVPADAAPMTGATAGPLLSDVFVEDAGGGMSVQNGHVLERSGDDRPKVGDLVTDAAGKVVRVAEVIGRVADFAGQDQAGRWLVRVEADNVRFSRGGQTANAARVPADEVKKHLKPIIDRVEASGAGVKVRLAEADELTDGLERSYADIHDVKGWYDHKNKTVTLLADRVSSLKGAEMTLMHEVVGHAGMQELLGGVELKKIRDAFKRLAVNPKGEAKLILDEVRQRYGGKENVDPETLMHEFFAVAAERRLSHGATRRLLMRVVKAIRSALRRIGFRLELSTLDVYSLLSESAKLVGHESGKGRTPLSRMGVVERAGQHPGLDWGGRRSAYHIDLDERMEKQTKWARERLERIMHTAALDAENKSPPWNAAQWTGREVVEWIGGRVLGRDVPSGDVDPLMMAAGMEEMRKNRIWGVVDGGEVATFINRAGQDSPNVMSSREAAPDFSRADLAGEGVRRWKPSRQTVREVESRLKPIADGIEKSGLGIKIRLAREKDLPEGLAEPGVLAFWETGTNTATIIVDRAKSATEAEETLAHEIVGHAGVDALLGGDLSSIEADLLKLFEKPEGEAATIVEEVRRRYGKDIDTRKLTREFIGVAAEHHFRREQSLRDSGVERLLLRVAKAVRRFLEKLGFKRKFSMEDVYSILSQAAELTGFQATGRTDQFGEQAEVDAQLFPGGKTTAEKWAREADRKYQKRLERISTSPLRKTRRFARKWLSRPGLLPEEIYMQKEVRDANLNAAEFNEVVQTLNWGLAGVLDAYGVKSKSDLTTEQLDEIQEALMGNDSALERLPESARASINEMRATLDALSDTIIGVLQKQYARMQKEGFPKGALKKKLKLINILENNKGTYLHRAYAAHYDPAWPDEVTEEVRDAAEEEIAKMLREQHKKMTKEQAKESARLIAERILYEGTAVDKGHSRALAFEGLLGGRDMGIMMRRKDIPEPIRKLLGEYRDPFVSYARSATKMVRWAANTEFLENSYALGIGKFFFRPGLRPLNQPGRRVVRMPKGPEYGPLAGLYTYEDVRDGLKDAIDNEVVTSMVRAMQLLNIAVKSGKTVGSPTTQSRNFLSNYLVLINNGNWRAFLEHGSFSKVASAHFKRLGSMDSRTFLRKMKMLGISGDAAHAREIQQMLRESGLPAAIETFFSNRGWEQPYEKVAGTLGLAQKLYEFGDDFPKILGWLGEVENLKAVHGGKKSNLWIEREAAQQIRRTMPTYSDAPKIIQELTRFPVLGPFVRFPYAATRAMIYEPGKLLIEEIGSPDPAINKRGYQRLTGMFVAASMLPIMSIITKALFGIGDEEEEAFRQTVPPWARNSQFVYLGRRGDGSILAWDSTYHNPNALAHRVLLSLSRDRPLDERVLDTAIEAIQPFISPEIVAGAAYEAVRNRTATGRRVYNPSERASKKALDVADHLWGALRPGILFNVEETYNAARGRRRFNEQPYDLNAAAAAWAGFRVTKVDLPSAVLFQAYDFTRRKGDSMSPLNQSLLAVSTSPTGDAGAVMSAFTDTASVWDEAYQDLGSMVYGATSLGASRSRIVRSLKAAGLSNVDIRYILRQRTRPIEMTTRRGLNLMIRDRLLGKDAQARETTRDRFRLAQSLARDWNRELRSHWRLSD